jgi:1,4-dihydroxy-2-naphthoate octaprenyltransferase
MRVATWGRAVRVIPRVTKEEWNALDPVARWLIATRSVVLVMTLVSSVIAGLLAARAGLFALTPWVVVTVGFLFAHATNNLVNDLVDHVNGVDRDNYFRTQYGPQPLEHGLLGRGQMLAYIAVTGGVALAAGLYLSATRGGGTLALLGLGVFFVLFYTWPLKYIGLGEIAVIVVWGPLMVGGGYYVMTGRLDAGVVMASLPCALAAATVLFGKHIDKLEADAARGIRTLPVLLGETNARCATIVMLSLQYGLVAYLVVTGAISAGLLVVLLGLGRYWKALRAYANPRPAAPPAEYPVDVWPLWYSAFTFQHTRLFGMLFLVGMIGDVVVQKVWSGG